MCLTIYDNAKPAGLIAPRDIICYKVLEVDNEGEPDATVTSPYQCYEYEFNRVYTAEITVVEGCRYREWEIEAGLHSFVTPDAAEDGTGEDECAYVFVAVIPKGTRYWVGNFNGKNDSYVSEALMVLHRDSPRSKRYLKNLPSKVLGD